MAIPSAAQFRAQFPEFTPCPDAVLDAHLAAAGSMCDETVYGDSHTQGVMYRCADALAQLPAGRKMQLVQKSGETVYYRRMMELVRSAAIGIRVV